MSEATARTMVGIMRGVTENGGTARQAAIDGYPVAGKTGTAQKAVGGHYDSQKYVASFVGFAPAQNPRIALIVVMDEPEGEPPRRRGRGAGVQGDRRAGAALPARAADRSRRGNGVRQCGAGSRVAEDIRRTGARERGLGRRRCATGRPLPPTEVPVAGDDETVADDSAREWDEVAGAEGSPADGAPAAKVNCPTLPA